MSEPAIRARGLTKRYGDLTAVDRLDLEVSPGEVFGLLGPNGAGKTTTILMLLGLSEPSGGEARVVGLDPTRQPLDVKRRVGYLPDNVGFYSDLTGTENLLYTARLNGIDEDSARKRTREVLEQVGLSDAADARVGTYSRGMRQRLGVADALVKDPDVLILDEPTIALDPEAVQETLRLIRALPAERDVAVLLSSHLLYQVQTICDRVAIFVRGKVVVQGRVGELATHVAGRGVVVEVGTVTEEGVEEVLRRIPGVDTVERAADLWVVSAQRDVRGDIVRALTERGIGMEHLRRRGAELDDVYRRYFEGTNGDADGDAHGS